MVDHERTDIAPDTDPIPVQRDTTTQPPTTPPVQQAYHGARRTRGLWVRMTVAAVVLVVLLVFIIENGDSVDIGFFGAHLRLPVGVALLLAAIGGVLLVSVLSAGRVMRLHRTLRKAATKP
jgi:uncharacterized integral membrane protein